MGRATVAWSATAKAHLSGEMWEMATVPLWAMTWVVWLARASGGPKASKTVRSLEMGLEKVMAVSWEMATARGSGFATARASEAATSSEVGCHWEQGSAAASDAQTRHRRRRRNDR